MCVYDGIRPMWVKSVQPVELTSRIAVLHAWRLATSVLRYPAIHGFTNEYCEDVAEFDLHVQFHSGYLGP